MKPALPILLASVAATFALALARADDGPPLRAVWRLSRGEGIAVAVVATDTRFVDAIRASAPRANVQPLEPQNGRRTRKRSESDHDDDGAALARAIDTAVEHQARVLLVAFALRSRHDAVALSLRRAREKGVIVFAPAGDEGLSIGRFPADEPGVIGVAALTSEGALSLGTNAGARTALAAHGATSFDAAAEAATAAALALAFDPSLGAGDVARALTVGPTASRASPRGGEPSRLDVSLLLDALRPRSRLAVVRDARILPVHVPSGEPARLAFTVDAVGRLPARGPVVVEGPGLHVLVPFAALSPGESRDLEAEVVLRADSPPTSLRLPDQGTVAAAPVALSLSLGSRLATIACDVVPPHQRPRSLRIVRVAVRQGLSLAATIENAGADAEEAAEARLVAPGGLTLAQVTLPRLASGERATKELEAAPTTEESAAPVHAALEIARRPPGFRETVEERWPLALDLGPPSPKRDATRR